MIELLDAIDRAEGEARRELGESVCEVLRFLVECARDGDERALPPLRVALECRPAYFGRVGIADFATKAMAISGAGSKDVFARELFIKEIEAVRDEVAGPNPTALERLLAERVALSWFDSHQREIAGLEAMTRGCGLDEAEYHSRQRTRASARFLAATRAIATVKRLAMPVLHIHKDETPPAPVAPERLRVLTDRPG